MLATAHVQDSKPKWTTNHSIETHSHHTATKQIKIGNIRGTTYLPCRMLMSPSDSCWIKGTIQDRIYSSFLFFFFQNSQCQTTSAGWSTSGPGTTRCPGNQTQLRARQGVLALLWSQMTEIFILGRKFLLRGWWGTGCPEKLCVSHPWRCSVLCWVGSWQSDPVSDNPTQSKEWN